MISVACFHFNSILSLWAFLMTPSWLISINIIALGSCRCSYGSITLGHIDSKTHMNRQQHYNKHDEWRKHRFCRPELFLSMDMNNCSCVYLFVEAMSYNTKPSSILSPCVLFVFCVNWIMVVWPHLCVYDWVCMWELRWWATIGTNSVIVLT